MSLKALNIAKEFGDPAVKVIDDVSFEIQNGEFVSLLGKSGSGKSTMLYILGTLDTPSRGIIELDGTDVTKIDQKTLHRFRNQKMGFVFQFHYLLSDMTALENVLMPAVKAEEVKSRTDLAISLLNDFGLGKKLDRLPRQLSGGEQQRVAIARSLIMEPDYLFADEPTGALDSSNGDLVMKILTDINTTRKTTIVLVTHDPDFANMAGRRITLIDGRISEDTGTLMST